MEAIDLIEVIRKEIIDSPQKYPFIAPMWEINIVENHKLKVAHYHKHQTKSHLTRPFYKPISKIFDIEKMDLNEK